MNQEEFMEFADQNGLRFTVMYSEEGGYSALLYENGNDDNGIYGKGYNVREAVDNLSQAIIKEHLKLQFKLSEGESE